MNDIIIEGATQGNLKNISLTIPRNKLVVLTGVSGSGKSTLAIDVLYQECQRQYLEAISFQGINKPKVEAVKNVSGAIVISQNENNQNPRSTLGTMTNIYSDIRMIYEKMGTRKCPHCGKLINNTDCKEEFIRDGDDYIVYMYCPYCGYKMEKLTRSHFSFNTQKGACPKCSGLGIVLSLDLTKVINEALSLETGAIDYWHHRYQDYQIEHYYQVLKELDLPIPKDKAINEYNEKQKIVLLYGSESKEFKDTFGEVKTTKFEGVITNLWRRLEEKSSQSKECKKYFKETICPECQGERLNKLSREVTVNNTKIMATTTKELSELLKWIEQLEENLTGLQKEAVLQYIYDLKTKLKRINNVGLGYLHLDRQTMTLSGGEKQRIKLAASLDSELVGMIYILDEPTIGLHPKDTQGIIKVLQELRERGNTVIVIEHDLDVIQSADYIIDIGPESGKYGGQIVATGCYQEVINNQNSSIARYLARKNTNVKKRIATNYLEVRNANIHNLKNIDVKFATNCLNVVTGVSGSGKSTLVFDVLAKDFNHDDLIEIKQSSIVTMKRSNIATYSGIYDEIRKIFGNLSQTKELKMNAKHFSFNSVGGRCEHCQGLGVINSNMLFFQDVEITCPTCHGKRFIKEVLAIKYHGYSIDDVLHFAISECLEVFKENKKIVKIATMLVDVGLGYLELGQTLTTLSGGEKQRLQLAKELITNKKTNLLYLIDEPTTGLHSLDVEHLLVLFNRMVDAGNTLIIVEHNLQVINKADWIVDLGPGGGNDGGHVIYQGPLELIKNNPDSITGKFL